MDRCDTVSWQYVDGNFLPSRMWAVHMQLLQRSGTHFPKKSVQHGGYLGLKKHVMIYCVLPEISWSQYWPVKFCWCRKRIWYPRTSIHWRWQDRLILALKKRKKERINLSSIFIERILTLILHYLMQSGISIFLNETENVMNSVFFENLAFIMTDQDLKARN